MPAGSCRLPATPIAARLLDAGQHEAVEWIHNTLQMPLRKVQIFGSGFQVTMTQQHLDRSQIRPAFKQMRRKAVP
jgi:hypothetical protein